MATELNVLANGAYNTYRTCITERMFELAEGNDVTTLNAVTELTEEYAAYVTALKGAQDREDANYGAFTAFVDAFTIDIDDATSLEDACNSFDNAFIGTMSVLQYAEQYLDEVYSIAEFLQGYVDYAKFAQDLQLGGDITENDGHIFHSNW
jgi:hypothetical protein